MFDTGLWLFCGLVVLFAWRALFWWRCCGHFLRYLNYISLLFVLLFVILVYDFYEFYSAVATTTTSQWAVTPGWLKVIVYAAPPVSGVSFILASFQVQQHVATIQDDPSPSSVLRHDRAVQIIILPVVYGIMSLSCVTKCYRFLLTDGGSFDSKNLSLAVVKAETCLWIGDLYESWALYQFGVLSLEVMESSLNRQSHSKEQEERAAARALIAAHTAITRLAWLGILSFVLVSIADSAVALWYITFGVELPDFVHRFNAAENQFNVAGFMASCAAIFNVYVVETQFHDFLEEFHPYLKFLTVKILVTFAYGQIYLFEFLKTLTEMAPTRLKEGILKTPVLGSIVSFNDCEFYMFYAGLLVIECFTIGIMHVFAWGASELWYEDDELESTDNKKALMPGSLAQYGASNA